MFFCSLKPKSGQQVNALFQASATNKAFVRSKWMLTNSRLKTTDWHHANLLEAFAGSKTGITDILIQADQNQFFPFYQYLHLLGTLFF